MAGKATETRLEPPASQQAAGTGRQGGTPPICRHIVLRDPETMSDHIKTSEQREEERRAGALDSTKDQALSKDSLQHVRATAGHTDIIAAAADIQAARHSVATGPATASSSTPDRGELDLKDTQRHYTRHAAES